MGQKEQGQGSPGEGHGVDMLGPTMSLQQLFKAPHSYRGDPCVPKGRCPRVPVPGRRCGAR